MESLVSAIAFPAPRLPLSFYSERLLNRDDLLYLKTSHGERIPAVYVRARQQRRKSNSKRGGGQHGRGVTILYAHGNAEDICLHLNFVEAMSKLTGSDVLSFEYVGYSLSRFEGGQPSEEAAYRSIDAAWRYLTEEARVPPSRIVVYGRSIGTGPAVDLCSRQDHLTLGSGDEQSAKIFFDFEPAKARGLFLQSPLESGLRCAFGYVSSFLLSSIDIFRNYDKIHRVRCPLAVIHGTRDAVVPASGAKSLLQQAKASRHQRNGPDQKDDDDANNNNNTRESVSPPEQESNLDDDGFFVRERWLKGYGHNDMPYDQVFHFLHDFLRDIGGPLPALEPSDDLFSQEESFTPPTTS